VDFSIVSRGILSSESLTSVWVKSDSSVALHVPAALRPRQLEIYAPRVRLQFDDVRTSVARLEALSIVAIESDTPPQLAAELTAIGRGLSRLPTPSATFWHFYLGGGIGGSDDWEHHSSVYRGAERMCRCGMCWSCLRLQSGSASCDNCAGL
jgi:hypothetical protein